MRIAGHFLPSTNSVSTALFVRFEPHPIIAFDSLLCQLAAHPSLLSNETPNTLTPRFFCPIHFACRPHSQRPNSLHCTPSASAQL